MRNPFLAAIFVLCFFITGVVVANAYVSTHTPKTNCTTTPTASEQNQLFPKPTGKKWV